MRLQPQARPEVVVSAACKPPADHPEPVAIHACLDQIGVREQASDAAVSIQGGVQPREPVVRCRSRNHTLHLTESRWTLRSGKASQESSQSRKCGWQMPANRNLAIAKLDPHNLVPLLLLFVGYPPELRRQALIEGVMDPG